MRAAAGTTGWQRAAATLELLEQSWFERPACVPRPWTAATAFLVAGDAHTRFTPSMTGRAVWAGRALPAMELGGRLPALARLLATICIGAGSLRTTCALGAGQSATGDNAGHCGRRGGAGGVQKFPVLSGIIWSNDFQNDEHPGTADVDHQSGRPGAKARWPIRSPPWTTTGNCYGWSITTRCDRRA